MLWLGCVDRGGDEADASARVYGRLRDAPVVVAVVVVVVAAVYGKGDIIPVVGTDWNGKGGYG
jgi:hypothetical protein